MLTDSYSQQDTFELGKQMGEKAVPGQIYALNGDLGTGKTVFAQGFAAGLGIPEYVNSPTFTILQIYEGGRLHLYHFDVYRIGDISEMDEIGCEEFFYGEGVCLVEWAELISDLLPPGSIQVNIRKDPDKGFDYRCIEVKNL